QEYWAGNDKYTIEVIGNIHENPELLEDVSDN
ncbi:YopX family protein, partial [Fructobacillus fructosus]